MRIKVGTRSSLLALKQVDEIKSRVKNIEFDVVPFETKGDRDKTTPLALVKGSDFFTYEIEQALIKGEIDIALHSAKDLGDNMPEGLMLAAMTGSISPFDSLVALNDLRIEELPRASRVGTSSSARREAINRYRPDLIVKDIRGNVDERLKELDKGHYDAVIVAHAALIRLRYQKRAYQVLPFSIIEPHPLQGRLAVEIKKERKDLAKIFGRIHEK